MKHLLSVTAGFGIVLVLAGDFPVQAQSRAAGGLPSGLQHALLDVFAGGPAFRGKVTFQLPNGADKDPTILTGTVWVLSGAMRVELNSFDPGTNVPPDEASNLRQMRPVFIVRPDRNRTYLVFSQFNSWVETPYYTKSGTDPAPAAQITKTLAGKEAIGIQPCEKSQWSVTESTGEHHDVTVWAATNLSNFPIQISVDTPPSVISFQELHLEEPSASLFVPPPGYQKYDGVPENILKAAARAQTNAPAQVAPRQQ